MSLIGFPQRSYLLRNQLLTMVFFSSSHSTYRSAGAECLIFIQPPTGPYLTQGHFIVRVRMSLETHACCHKKCLLLLLFPYRCASGASYELGPAKQKLPKRKLIETSRLAQWYLTGLNTRLTLENCNKWPNAYRYFIVGIAKFSTTDILKGVID